MLGSYSLSLWIDFSWRSVYYSAQESPADYRRQVRECRNTFWPSFWLCLVGKDRHM